MVMAPARRHIRSRGILGSEHPPTGAVRPSCARVVGTIDRIAAAEPEVREAAGRAGREPVLSIEILPTGARGGDEIAVYGRLAPPLEAGSAARRDCLGGSGGGI